MAFFDADDAAIYYDITGDGKPVILLHGYALNSLMWEYQKNSMAENFQLITVDLRGFGKSSCGVNWSGNAMAEDVSGLIEHLNLRNCAIVGFSMGGPVAFRLALKHPDRLTKLVMVSSILPSAGKAQKKKYQRLQQKELDTLTLHGVEKWAELSGLKSGPLVDNMFKRNPEIVNLWAKIIKRHNPDFLRCMLQARLNTPSHVNWRARLSDISQPVLIISGAQDSNFVDASRFLNRVIPDSSLEIISGAGHMVNLEKPDEFNKILIDFLKD